MKIYVWGHGLSSRVLKGETTVAAIEVAQDNGWFDDFTPAVPAWAVEVEVADEDFVEFTYACATDASVEGWTCYV